MNNKTTIQDKVFKALKKASLRLQKLNPLSEIQKAVLRNDFSFIRKRVERPDAEKALFTAIRKGYLDFVKYIVETFEDIPISDYLSDAIFFNKLDILKYLISKGADIHVDNNILFKSSQDNESYNYISLLDIEEEGPFEERRDDVGEEIKMTRQFLSCLDGKFPMFSLVSLALDLIDERPYCWYRFIQDFARPFSDYDLEYIGPKVTIERKREILEDMLNTLESIKNKMDNFNPDDYDEVYSMIQGLRYHFGDTPIVVGLEWDLADNASR